MARPKYMGVLQLAVLVLLSSLAFLVSLLLAARQLIRTGPRKFFSRRRFEQRPKVLDNPDLGSHHYARLKNVRLHYVSKGQEGRPLLLLLHGFPEIWYSWRFQIREFAQNFRVVAVDMRGYGESEKPEGTEQYTVDVICEDIKELIEYLGYEKCFLVGHDWGAAVAWSFAARYPSMTQKLIACNCPHGSAFVKYLNSHLCQLLKSWYMFLFQWPFYPEYLQGTDDYANFREVFTSKTVGIKPRNFGDDDLEAFLYSFKDFGDRTGPLNYYRAAMRYQPGTSETRVKSPTMIIWGTGDAFLSREMAELSRQFVDGECHVCYIEGATHWVQQDEPELVNKYMRDFLVGDSNKGH